MAGIAGFQSEQAGAQSRRYTFCRRFSGVGFFTDFVVPTDAAVQRDLPNMEIGDVGAEFPCVQHGAGFVLFIRDGVVRMLEGYTYDEPWPEKTDEFSLKRYAAA